MPGTKGKSGGRREGSGRRPVAQRKAPPNYRRLPMTEPRGKEQEAAMEWWESLTPRERTSQVMDLWDAKGYPKPHTKGKAQDDN